MILVFIADNLQGNNHDFAKAGQNGHHIFPMKQN